MGCERKLTYCSSITYRPFVKLLLFRAICFFQQSSTTLKAAVTITFAHSSVKHVHFAGGHLLWNFKLNFRKRIKKYINIYYSHSHHRRAGDFTWRSFRNMMSHRANSWMEVPSSQQSQFPNGRTVCIAELWVIYVRSKHTSTHAFTVK